MIISVFGYTQNPARAMPALLPDARDLLLAFSSIAIDDDIMAGATYREKGHDRGRPAPGGGRNVLARLSGERSTPTVIEHDVPHVPDRQVQLADRFADLHGSRMAAHQPQCRFESEPHGEQSAHYEVVHALRDAVAILNEAQDHLDRVARPPGWGIGCRLCARVV